MRLKSQKNNLLESQFGVKNLEKETKNIKGLLVKTLQIKKMAENLEKNYKNSKEIYSDKYFKLEMLILLRQDFTIQQLVYKKIQKIIIR